MPEWMGLVISILEAIVIIIPLVYALINFVKKASKEKNWDALLQLVIDLMQQAELKFSDGASRKEWVLMMIKASADTINYDINLDKISTIIDDLCKMSKIVNFNAENVEEVQEC